MIEAHLAHDVDWDGWRQETRRLLALRADPVSVRWTIGSAQPTPPEIEGTADAIKVPRAFIDLSRVLVRHRDTSRFQFLHRLASRLAAAPKLLEIASDDDVQRAEAWTRTIRRDRHKMTAFLRFRAVTEDDAERFVAWFEPSHRIEEDVAEFFVDRFASMRFTIVTPRCSIDWTDGNLTFGPGGSRCDIPESDGLSEAWNTYYRSTLNPARVRVAAMMKEMPRKYWANLPETEQIPTPAAFARSSIVTLMIPCLMNRSVA